MARSNARRSHSHNHRPHCGWGAHSIDWNRCSDPSYYGDLATEMHRKGIIQQETLFQHTQLTELLAELLRCFSTSSSNTTKRDIANMLRGAHWRDDGCISFGNIRTLDYQAGDEGEPFGLDDIVYVPYVPSTLQPAVVSLADLTSSLATVHLGNSGQAAGAA